MKLSRSDQWFLSINYILITLITLSCLLPLLHIVSTSLSNSDAVITGSVVFWPVGFSLESYQLMVEGTRIMGAFKNSVIITIVGVTISMLCTTLTAYPLSRKHLIFRNQFTMAAVFTMMFSGGLIPTYLVIKELGLINTYWSIWLPGAISTYNLLILRTFMLNIPYELDEAARIDGCGEWKMLINIYLPMCKPVLATLALFYGVGSWNAFFSLLLYINETHKLNLTVLVQQMIQSQSALQEAVAAQTVDIAQVTPEGIKAAGVVVMILPMLAVYPFLQKYIVKGVMLGAVKG